MATAADRALNVAELLERILLSLPMKDILLDQRVCKFWQDLTKNSPKLQQALFYRPDYNTETWTALDFAVMRFTDSAHVVEAVLPHAKHDTTAGEWHQKLVVGRANELLLIPSGSEIGIAEGSYRFHVPSSVDAARRTSFNSDSGSEESDQNEYEYGSDLSLVAAKSNGKPSADGFTPSWRNMFLSQPPSTVVTFPDCTLNSCDWTSAHWGSCKNKDSITAEILIDAMSKKYGKSRSALLPGRWQLEHGQHVEFVDITVPDLYLVEEGIEDFKRLEDLTGGKSNAFDICEQAGSNLSWLQDEDECGKIMSYGLLDQIDEFTCIDTIIWEAEHQPECESIKCRGCSTLYFAYKEAQKKRRADEKRAERDGASSK